METVALLKTAASAHVAYLGKAGKAEGCDRLLLGLRKMMSDAESVMRAYKM